MAAAVVEVTRGGIVESRHCVHTAAVHAGQGLIAAAGDTHCVGFVRSAIKMFQALPLVEDDGLARFDLTDAELALCTASHNAEPFHVAAAQSILRKIGLGEAALACGPHAPMHAAAAEQLAARGERPGRIHNNCSGKHAGMLALATLHDWPVAGYHQLQHPVQERVVQTLNRWMELDVASTPIGVDGCGLPTFALPLASVAGGCARLAAAAADGAPAPARIVHAMTQQPEFVAGTGRLCTELMRVTRGRLFAKVGAEGYYCAGAPGARVGLALKVEDGARRAAEVALLAVLRMLDLIDATELEALSAYARPPILNTRGEVVGEVRASLPPLR